MSKKIIRLVKENEKDNKLILNKDALKVIENIKGNIGVCLIAGPYKSGKSFLMNNLSGLNNAFEIGHTEDAQTKGIWMNTEPVKIRNNNSGGEEINIFFMDTEAVESLNNQSWDTKLFIAGILFSSVFIYNTTKVLSSEALDKLSIITSISEKIKVKSKMSEVHNKKQIKKESPDFMWLVRDCHFKSNKIANEKLEEFLEEEEIQGEKKRDEVTKRNSIRETIKDCFYSHNCFYLPEPVEPQRLTELVKINEKDYDEEYIRKLDNLKSELSKIIRPKMINNQNLNGKRLSEYLKLIVEAINDEKVFYIFDAFLKIEAEEALESTKKEYEKKMKELILPLKWNEFNNNEQRIYASLCDLFKIKLNEAYVGEFLNKFKDFRQEYDENFELIGGSLFKYTELNDEKIKEYNFKIAFDLWESKIKSKIKPNNIKLNISQFDAIVGELKNELKTKCFELEGNKFEKLWQEFSEKINMKKSRDYISASSNAKVGTIKISSEDLILYRGPRGGLLYITSGGSIVYVKEDDPRIKKQLNNDYNKSSFKRPHATILAIIIAFLCILIYILMH